ncbi:MAG: hypothetical protein ACYTG2_10015 [Planctomycetota bacterium]|jgi:hypothetical protein
METPIHNPIVLVALSIAITAAALGWSLRQGQGSGRSRRWYVLTALPGLLALSGFYSLAIHMHFRLGGWPDFYGTQKLPPELVTHADYSGALFGIVLLVALGMPLVLALCAMVARLRSRMIHPAACGAACWACLLLTQLAPAGFLRWWWD